MQIFIDTANIDEIKKYAAWGIIDGVTTNPTLIAREGANLEKRIKEISQIIDGPISVEVIATDSEGMLCEARKFAKWHKNIYIKIPIIPEGLKAIKALDREGIRTNATLCFSANQALLAAKAGATLVSPFVGRLDDANLDGMQIVADIITIYKNYGFTTKVVVASVRTAEHVTKSAKLGADIATIPPAVLEQLIKHPLTDKGIEKFLADHSRAMSTFCLRRAR